MSSTHELKGPQPVIGLVGGVGSGKSLVAGMLAELGCRVICADSIGHELLTQQEVIASLVERFGDGVLDETRSIDRSAVAQIVFDDPRALSDLNAIVHPRLKAELARRIDALRCDPDFTGAIVLDAALLLDTDWHELCGTIVFVDAPADVLDLKRSSSDHILRNNSSVSHLRQQVCLFYQRLVESTKGSF